jgi:hypothetical protein
VINEISLVGNVMLTFIDHRLHILEQVHDQFMGGINVIMTCNFTKFILFEIHEFKNKTNEFIKKKKIDIKM